MKNALQDIDLIVSETLGIIDPKNTKREILCDLIGFPDVYYVPAKLYCFGNTFFLFFFGFRLGDGVWRQISLQILNVDVI